MRRCPLWCCLLLLAAGDLLAAPPRAVSVFDEAPATGVPGSHLTIGHGGGRFGRMTAAEAAAIAPVTPSGALPVCTDTPYAGRVCLRVGLASAAWGDWEADLPMPPLAPLGDPRNLVLTLAARGDAAAAGLEIGFRDGAMPRHAIRIPLAGYGPVAASWTLYRIRLTEFTALLPTLDLDHLASLLIGSSRPAAGTVDIDQVLIQTADGDNGPAWVVTPAATRPAGATPPPTTTIVTPPLGSPPTAPTAVPATTPPRLTDPDQPSLPDVTEPTDPPTVATVDLPPTPVAPEASELRVVSVPDGPTPGVGAPPTPPIRVMSATDGGRTAAQPGNTGTQGRPTTEVTPPTPTTPPTPAGPPQVTVTPPAVPKGPPAVAPSLGGAPRLEPGDTRPMSVVSVYFGGGAAGPYADSHLRAVWATNRGEREFDAAELKSAFDVTDDGRLPIVADEAVPAGSLKLEIKEAGFAWWLARLNLSDERVANEGNWLKNGRLEIRVRGAAGGEVFRLGLVDGQQQPEMALEPLNRYGSVTTEWQTIRVPLRALKAQNPKLDWSKVRAAVLASASGKPLTVHIAEVRIVNPAQN